MCGIIAIIGSPSSSFEVYRALLTLQHRGQDAAGILSYQFSNDEYQLKKGKGLVADVFDSANLALLPGQMAIGHTRYATIGTSDERNFQPHYIGHLFGIGMAHHGNIVN